MSSTLVHVAFAALVGAALLGPHFDRRSLAVVLAAAALPDLDTFLGLWIEGGHRAVLHTTLFPVALALLLAWDLRWREQSAIRARWGSRGVRTAWVSVVAVAVAGIGPDLFTNGVNVLYPVHDQFYRLSGEFLLSDQRGVVQSFVDLSPPPGEPPGGAATDGGGGAVGSTEEVHYSTGVDPEKGTDSPDAERILPVVQSGFELLVVLAGTTVAGVRLWLDE